MICLQLFLCGCQGQQSALDPVGEQARRIDGLWWLLFFVTAAIYVIVLALTIVAAGRRDRRDSVTDAPVETLDPLRERKMGRFVGAGVAITVAILFIFLIADFSTGKAMHAMENEHALTIEVTGHRWWWEVKYKDDIPGNIVVTANEIHLPINTPVKFELKSTDVIHSFWAPNFNGKKDAIPGHSSAVWFRATRAGEFRGQCAEYCGYQHAHMRFVLIAESREDFERWRREAGQPAREPTSDVEKLGQQKFLSGTCVMCHTIAGTVASATVGPSLTHVGSRHFIGAASFENQPAMLRAWILNPQHFKPGVIMPQQTLTAEEVEGLAAYLGSLK
jgi:cytochrome c oxidase subunit 2